MATISSDVRGNRIVTLDIVRGIAVMGILAMNIVGFALPPQAYLNPLADGADGTLDLAAYAFNFVLVDGKMRGLFSFLFGASMLLVAENAEAKGDQAGSVIVRRQLWLLVFGMIHFYLIWYGDILIGYALIGMIAWLLRRKSAESLVAIGILLVAAQLALIAYLAVLAHQLAPAVAAGTADAEALSVWAQLTRDIATPEPARMHEILALYLGPWTGVVHHQLTEQLAMPIVFTFMFGWETLAYMLFGMAGLKSGFLTGDWSNSSYRRTALAALAIAIPAYALLAALLFANRFGVEWIYTYTMAGTVPFRPLMVVAYAALIILLTRNGGLLVDRIAAAGRAAFSNYLGTSIVMTGLFYGWGLGLFGEFGRAELWLVVIAMWALMLAWSKPWLDHFAYGPLEWAWRSLARWKLQPIGKAPAAVS